jgi:protein SCO1/2
MTSIEVSPLTKPRSVFEKILLSKMFWLFFCSFFFFYPLIRSINRELPPELPKMFQLPTYNLVDENGMSFGSENLKGKIYITNFHFTSCPTICVELMKNMQVIQKRVRGVGTNINLVSITVDPEYDNSKILFKKARELHANAHIWKFLTGDSSEIENLLMHGFKVAMGKPETYESVYDIAHSGKLVLVDDQGWIRGYYSTDKDSVNRLMIDVGLLINRTKLNFKKNNDDIPENV